MIEKSLEQEKTKDTPYVFFDASQGEFKISGRSIINDDQFFFDFYQPIIDYLEEYRKVALPKSTFYFDIEYLDSRSWGFYFDIFSKIDKLQECTELSIVWYYENDDQLDLGDDYHEHFINLPIEFIDKNEVNSMFHNYSLAINQEDMLADGRINADTFSFRVINARFNYIVDNSSETVYWNFFIGFENNSSVSLQDVQTFDSRTQITPDSIANEEYDDNDVNQRHSLWLKGSGYLFEGFDLKLGNWNEEKQELFIKGIFELVHNEDQPIKDKIVTFQAWCKFEGESN
ncbi:hypothetical protein BKI52_43665 [marine bacterium AO1-C]|nr:hypothetical protein BKI52_43665 [marine bacterium AO1-C]